MSRDRPIEWTALPTTQGDVLDTFASHCRDDLDDVEVESYDGTVLVARWRAETSRIETRATTDGIAHVAGGPPVMLLTDLEPGGTAIVDAFLDDATLRSSVVVLDLQRLEKLGAVKSSVFVYFDWFLRETYGVRVLPANRFTQGLLARGIISLGMG